MQFITGCSLPPDATAKSTGHTTQLKRRAAKPREASASHPQRPLHPAARATDSRRRPTTFHRLPAATAPPHPQPLAARQAEAAPAAAQAAGSPHNRKVHAVFGTNLPIMRDWPSPPRYAERSQTETATPGGYAAFSTLKLAAHERPLCAILCPHVPL